MDCIQGEKGFVLAAGVCFMQSHHPNPNLQQHFHYTSLLFLDQRLCYGWRVLHMSIPVIQTQSFHNSSSPVLLPCFIDSPRKPAALSSCSSVTPSLHNSIQTLSILATSRLQNKISDIYNIHDIRSNENTWIKLRLLQTASLKLSVIQNALGL